MGLMGRIVGMGGAARRVGEAVTGVAEVFVGNRAERDAAEHEAFAAALAQHGEEFATVRDNAFDGFVNGLNRLPRPMLALGTLGLFAYAMAEPAGFSVRMQGLAHVPEPLWWLLGAVVSFYFGARELHYRRGAAAAAPGQPVERLAFAGFLPAAGGCPVPEPDVPAAAPAAPAPTVSATTVSAFPALEVRAADPQFNAALEEWRRRRA